MALDDVMGTRFHTNYNENTVTKFTKNMGIDSDFVRPMTEHKYLSAFKWTVIPNLLSGTDKNCQSTF